MDASQAGLHKLLAVQNDADLDAPKIGDRASSMPK
jgi:hypothetical protein